MITFSPGPAQVYPAVRQYLTDAYDADVLSMSHRGTAFVDLSRQTIELVKDRLNVPADYTVLYVSSATESWEILAQSLTRQKSLYLFNGAFGERGFQYARYLREGALPWVFERDESVDPKSLPVDDTTEMIAYAQNETSNGTQLPAETMAALRAAYPEPLLAADVTSSLAGLAHDLSLADVWYASVQKCFGLPAGLGLLILSPRAVARALEIDEQDHYNSLPLLLKNIEKYQTSYTPNVLGIYLLNRTLAAAPNVRETDARLRANAAAWYEAIGQLPRFSPLITNAAVRSDTVVAVRADPAVVTDVTKKALAAGLTLGRGYGDLKADTFRIANFPALTDEDHRQLRNFLTTYAVGISDLAC